MKIKERALSLLLSLVMVLTFMPALVFADCSTDHAGAYFIEGYESDCWDDGQLPYWYCPDCDTMFADDNGELDPNTVYASEDDLVIPKGHKLQYHPETEGLYFDWDGDFYTTCKEYWECTACGDLFADEDGEDDIYSMSSLYYDIAEASETNGGSAIIEKDGSIWTGLNKANDAISDANKNADAGNLDAAANYANTAKASADALSRDAAAQMNKANSFSNNLSDSYSKEVFLEYIRETVDYATSTVNGANAVVNKVNEKLADRAFNGTPDGSVPNAKSVKAKAAKKSFTVTWKKADKKKLKKFDKVEIQWSQDPSFPRTATTVKEVKKTKKSLKVKKLAKKSVYYVRVRDIKYVGGVKYVSGWSKVKKVKIK